LGCRKRIHLLRDWRGGYIHSFEKSRGRGIDKVRLTDRFFLGEPQLRGFDIRGVGPRVQRISFDAAGAPILDQKRITDDALGGRALYQARAELEIPLGSSGRELGLRPSVFLDAGAVFGLKAPPLIKFCAPANATDNGATISPGQACPAGTTPSFEERFWGTRQSRAFRSASASTGSHHSARSGLI
jgi:outer membrane protein insertion porin family